MLVSALSSLVVFCALANGAHDLWAATLAYWAVLVALAAAVARASLRKEPLSRDFLLALLAIAAPLCASASRAGNPAQALSTCADWLASSAVFWLSLQAFRDEPSVRLCTALVAPLFWLELAVIVYQRHAARSLVPIPQTALDSGVTAVRMMLSDSVPGTLVNSNAAAAFHLLWLPVLARRAFDERNAAGRRSLFWIASATCCLLGILLLNSTSAVICLLFGAPFIAGPKKVAEWVRRRPRLSRAAAAGLIAAAAGLILHKFLKSDDGTGHSISMATKISRLSWWWAGLNMFRDHPVFGIGPGNFPSAFLAYKTVNSPNTLFAHSFPVGFMSETGSAGLAGLLLFFAAWLSRLRLLHDALRPRWPFLLGAAMILAYTTINIGFEYLANLLCLALFLGVAVAPAVEARWRPTRLAAALTATLCLTAAAYAAVPFVSSRLLVAGDELLKNGDATAALKSYEEAALLYPLSAEARRGRARALYVRSRMAGSRRDLQEAVAEQERALPLDLLNASLRAELEVYRKMAGP